MFLNRFCIAALLMSLWLTSAHPISAQQESDPVIATVNDDQIFQSQVDHEFHVQFADRQVASDLEQGIRNRIAERLINQQLILHRFAESEVLATEDEVNLAISRIKEDLAKTDKTLEQHCLENHLSEAALRFNLKWQISWKRYLDRSLSEQVLERYFNRNHKQFDGTEVRTAHILWKPDADAAMDSLVETAKQVRRALESGEISWNDAVARYSTASGENEGDTGWIRYSGPMSKGFTAAALGLQIDEISQPITTPFGVHLIKCTDIRPGTTPWYDVQDAVRRAATHELFGLLSDKQRPSASIQRLEPESDADRGDR